MTDQYTVLQQASTKGSKYAKQYIKHAQNSILLKAKLVSYNNYVAESNLNRAALNMVGIKLYAESGNFIDLGFGNWESINLRTAYLGSLNRRYHGFNSISLNSSEFDDIYKQNGPKRMEQRLYNFIKRTIRKKSGALQ